MLMKGKIFYPCPPTRLLSGWEGPAFVLTFIRSPGYSPRVHVSWSKVPVCPRKPTGVRCGPSFPSR